MPNEASSIVALGYPVLALAIAVAVVMARAVAGRRTGEDAAATRKAVVVTGAVAAIWLAVTGALSSGGMTTATGGFPPPLMRLVLVLAITTTTLALTGFGTRLVDGLPMWALVGAQGFRLPLELLMHRTATEGIMPDQMSYSGYNFDIVTGATAIALAVTLGRGPVPRWVVVAWNALGIALLVNVLWIAIASIPTFAAFGPDRINTWVGHFPYTWLPAVMVQAALFGHVAVGRKLMRQQWAPEAGSQV